MLKSTLFTVLLAFCYHTHCQVNQPEIGIEVGATNFGTQGGSVGGALRLGLAEPFEEALTYGAMFRYHYFWNNNNFTGIGGSGSLYGGGLYAHYRFMEWFFAGAEIEYVRNPFQFTSVSRRWALAAFLAAGVSKDFDWVRMNIGLQYDVADAIRDPLQPSPFRNQYFLRLNNPAQPGAGGEYLPIIYRLTFFFTLGRSNEADEELNEEN